MKVFGPDKPCKTPWDDILTTSAGTDTPNSNSWEVIVDYNGNVLIRGY